MIEPDTTAISYNEPKTIVVFLDETRAGSERLDAALRLAMTFHAHVIGLFVQTLPHARSNEAAAFGFARGSAGIDAAADFYFTDQDTAMDVQRRRLDAVAAEWRVIPANASLRAAALHCSYSDLLVLPPAGGSAQPWSGAELVVASGIAGILIPENWKTPIGRRIAIGWNASRVARRAIADAMPFLIRADRVLVAVVDPNAEEGTHGEETGADIGRLLARHNVKSEVVRLESEGKDVARAVLTGALRFEADLVVAGAYGHSRFAEFVHGSTTRGLLDETSLPILISH
jgi:nucleotide-binding universal stress UspA family protein